ncbi:MAG: hypothetical protein GY861_18170 [bacterium]|nr:hypothetical protein [bacterium]
MIIICEGVDKAGKSTIISDLENFFEGKAIVMKLSQKPVDGSALELVKVRTAYAELFHQARLLSEKGHTVIFDRSYPSELVYSTKRGYEAFENHDWDHFDESLKDLVDKEEILLIYCSAEDETIKQRFVSDREEFMSPLEIPVFKERYEKFLTKTILPYTRIDSMQDRLANLITIQNLLNKQDEHSGSQGRLF